MRAPTEFATRFEDWGKSVPNCRNVFRFPFEEQIRGVLVGILVDQRMTPRTQNNYILKRISAHLTRVLATGPFCFSGNNVSEFIQVVTSPFWNN